MYERHGPALVAYACGCGLSAADAEDAVHTVFHRILLGLTGMPENPVAYLYRAVRNTAMNAHRNSAREASLAEHESVFVHRTGNRETALALQRALTELPDEQREVIVMRIWSGMTLEEIAASKEVSLNTVASRCRYGLEKLRERMLPSQKARKEKDEP